jgi:hypothetical protein
MILLGTVYAIMSFNSMRLSFIVSDTDFMTQQGPGVLHKALDAFTSNGVKTEFRKVENDEHLDTPINFAEDTATVATKSRTNDFYHGASANITCKLQTAACLYIKEENHRLIEWYVSLYSEQFPDCQFWISV